MAHVHVQLMFVFDMTILQQMELIIMHKHNNYQFKQSTNKSF